MDGGALGVGDMPSMDFNRVARWSGVVASAAADAESCRERRCCFCDAAGGESTTCCGSASRDACGDGCCAMASDDEDEAVVPMRDSAATFFLFLPIHFCSSLSSRKR